LLGRTGQIKALPPEIQSYCVVTVHWSGYYLLSQPWNDLADFKEAYKLDIVDTLVGPFDALLAAFIVNAFGKMALRCLITRLARTKE
jgi:hypothetical protein